MSEHVEVLIKTFSDLDCFENVALPLSLHCEKVIYLSHDSFKEKKIRGCREVLLRNGIKEVIFDVLKNDKSEVKHYLSAFPDAAIDMTGSRYLLMCLFEEARRDNRRIYYYDALEEKVKEYDSHRVVDVQMTHLSIGDLITLGGGKITSHLHHLPNLKDVTLCEMIENTVRSNLNNYSRFVSYVTTLDKMLQSQEKESSVYILDDKTDEWISHNPLTPMAIKNGLFSHQKHQLRFYNTTIANMFQVSGSWLEIYLYLQLIKDERFDDVEMSVVIDFSENHDRHYPVTCEIDVLASSENHLFFISCKSNKVDAAAINEIKLHSQIFGNTLSRAGIATAEDLSKRSEALSQKAKELNVTVLQHEHFLKGNCAQTLLSSI